jgi:hypothetical protein
MDMTLHVCGGLWSKMALRVVQKGLKANGRIGLGLAGSNSTVKVGEV